MTAIPNLDAISAPLPAFSAVGESIPYAPQKITFTGELALNITETGLIVYRGNNPIAWIVPGYHKGQQDLQPKQCDFVDVSYFRQTQRGQNLETADFQALPDALQFVADMFGGEL